MIVIYIYTIYICRLPVIVIDLLRGPLQPVIVPSLSLRTIYYYNTIVRRLLYIRFSVSVAVSVSSLRQIPIVRPHTEIMFKLSLLCVAAVLALASQEAHGKMTCKYCYNRPFVVYFKGFGSPTLYLIFPFSGKLPQVQIPDDWITMVDPCTKKMKEQVQEELTAAMTYFAMVIRNNKIILHNVCWFTRLIMYNQ